MTVGRPLSLPIKIINEVRHLLQLGSQSSCEPAVFPRLRRQASRSATTCS